MAALLRKYGGFAFFFFFPCSFLSWRYIDWLGCTFDQNLNWLGFSSPPTPKSWTRTLKHLLRQLNETPTPRKAHRKDCTKRRLVRHTILFIQSCFMNQLNSLANFIFLQICCGNWRRRRHHPKLTGRIVRKDVRYALVIHTILFHAPFKFAC